MKTKIVAFLKTQLQGVPEKFINGVAELYSKTILDEKDIETVLNGATIEALKYSANELQVEGDKRATSALKTYLEKHSLTEDGKSTKPEQPKTEAPKPEEAPAWAKDLQAKFLSLDEKIKSSEKEKTYASLSGKVADKLKEKGIPTSFYKGRTMAIESEDQIDQLIASVETDFQSFKQDLTEQGVIVQKPLMGSGHKGIDVDMDKYLNEKFPSKK